MNDEIKEILEIFKQVDLEQEVGGCYNCPKKDKDKICIGCLNNAKDKLLDYITDLQQENERLNNIINELEEWLDSFVIDLLGTIKYNNDEYWEIIHQEKYEDRVEILNLVLDKLKELKGSDSND